MSTEVVGVVQDARQSDWTSPIDEEVYLPYLQAAESTGTYLTFVVRATVDAEPSSRPFKSESGVRASSTMPVSTQAPIGRAKSLAARQSKGISGGEFIWHGLVIGPGNEMKYCEACGAETLDRKYCGECGAATMPVSTQAPS